MKIPSVITDSSGGTASATIPATAAYQVLTFPVNLAEVADTEKIQLDLGFAGTLIAINFRVGHTPASTSNKLTTLTGQVNGSSVTGGVVSLTTTACNAVGAEVAGTAITAGNTFTAGQTVGYIASATTAFVEGNGVVELVVRNDDLNNFLAQAAASLNALRDVVRSLA